MKKGELAAKNAKGREGRKIILVPDAGFWVPGVTGHMEEIESYES